MSKVAITGNASGTGTLTVAAPNTNSDYTLTLPTQTGTIVSTDASGNVGIGLSSPTSKLHVSGGAGTNVGIQSSAGRHWRLGDGVGSTNGNFVIYDYTGSAKRLELDTSGNLLFNSGYGSAATAYGVRAWVKLNQSPSPDTISGSGNVSSLTEIGTGRTQINFANAMPDSNYAAVSGLDNNINQWWVQSYSTGSCLVAMYTGSAYTDQNNVCVLIVR